MTSGLWLPRLYQSERERELVETRIKDTAEKLKMVELDPLCVQLTAEARKLDDKVSIVRVKDNAEGPGIRPGYYHVMRFNEGAPLSLTPIEAKDGGFLVPTQGTIDRLRASDTWNERVVRDRRERARAEEQAIAKQEQTETEERRDEILQRWKAVSETSVSMNRDAPWSQNVKGRKGVKS